MSDNYSRDHPRWEYPPAYGFPFWPTENKRISEVYCKVKGKKVFEVEQLEYCSSKEWHKCDSSTNDLHLEIEPSDLEKIGLQTDSFGKISLKKQNRVFKALRTTAKYIVGIGVPLIASYLIADYLSNIKIQNYITRNLPEIIENHSDYLEREERIERRKEDIEQIIIRNDQKIKNQKIKREQVIRNDPKRFVGLFGIFKIGYIGLGLALGGITSFINGYFIRDGIRTKKPELRKVKKILRKYAGL